MGFYDSPRWSAEVADCSMPMTFDTYSNCSFGCLYCFSQYQRGIGDKKEKYHAKEVRQVSVNRIKRMFLDPDKHAGSFAPYIKQRRVMQWGGLSDQFDNFERRMGVTLELLRFFKEIDYPLCFSTKATWWTKDERYMELVRGQKNWNFKFSIITLDEAKARAVERGVPSPSERLEALGRIAEAGAGGATLRLRPFIIGISTPSYLELIRLAAVRGAGAVSTEFFCADIRSRDLRAALPTLNNLCGYDLLEFYKRYSDHQGYMRLNRKIKRPFVESMKRACDEAGMRFYVSDAHFKELCANGSCCGLPPGWNYSRGQFCQALCICRDKGSVRWADIAEDARSLLQFPFEQHFNCSSENRAHFHGMSAAEHQRWLWNNPQSAQSPYRMFGGVMRPASKDENGDIIYVYDKQKSILTP